MPTREQVISEVPEGVCAHEEFHAVAGGKCNIRGKVKVRDQALLEHVAKPDFLLTHDDGGKACRSHYGLSFLIPFLSVSAMYSYDVLGAPYGYIEALGGGLLAGLAGWTSYKLIKFIRHRKVAVKA